MDLQIFHYLTPGGRNPFREWLEEVRDPTARRGQLAGFSQENEMKRSSRALALAGAQRSHAEATVESFRRHPRHAVEYLDAVLTDGDRAEVLTALRYVVDAFGGIPGLARKAGLNPTTLYRTLSSKGNPELKSLTAVLDAMGMRLAVKTSRPRGAGPAKGRPPGRTASRRARLAGT